MNERLQTGALLDRYELLECIGSGGMGSVWLAHYHGAFGFRKRVAVKVILAELANEPHYRKMFLDEAHVMSRVNHPNVAQVLDVGEDDGRLFLALEWIDGLSLEQLLRVAVEARESIPVSVLLRVVADAAAGAHAAHELAGEDGAPLGVIHRDISPHNILVGAAGHAKLIDFGIAKSALREATATRTGHARGKPSYLAPEQAMRFEVDRRADVWALGATLYRALEGRPPFGDVEQLVAYVYKASPIAPMSPHVAGVVEAVVTRALAVEPRRRFATAEELRDALEGAMSALGAVVTHSDVARYVASLRRDTEAPPGVLDDERAASDETADESTTAAGGRGA